MPDTTLPPHPWTFEQGHGPIVATAIHGGHDLRPEVARHITLPEAERLREEDPFTGDWTTIGDSRVVAHRSRFEVDLNRPRKDAVYLEPDSCWGLDVWCKSLPEEVAEESRRLHDRFYEQLGSLLTDIRDRFGRFVLLDLHTYNHRRDGKDMPAADPAENPDINLGTESVDRGIWGTLIDRLVEDIGSFEVDGLRLEVGDNVKFKGAYLVRWVNANFPESCALAIEVKKIFMDELTGELDHTAWKEVHRALEAAAAGCLEMLGR